MGQALGCIQVDQSKVAVKEQFGRFNEVLEPGCHCMPWCFGYNIAGELSLRVQQLDVRCETKTKVCYFVILIMIGCKCHSSVAYFRKKIYTLPLNLCFCELVCLNFIGFFWTHLNL